MRLFPSSSFSNLSSLLIFISFLFLQIEGHTKLFSTDLELSPEGNPVRSRGWAPVDSTYVHIWGPANGEKQAIFANSDTYPSETLTKHLISRRHPTCTGRAPPFERLAKVNPGGRLTFLWPTNNHGGEPIQLFWDRSGPIDPNAAEPAYESWVNPGNEIFRSSYREGGETRCAFYDFNNPNDPLANIIKESFPDQQNTPNERYACWATWTVPTNMQPGLNRVLFGWRHPPNDAYFYDCYWLFINGGAAPPPQSNSGGSNGLLSPVLFNYGYYMNRYSDLAQNGIANEDMARNHWINTGINEGRRASPTFDPPFYLNSHSDLVAAFGDRGYQAAALHYLRNGMAEGRQACQECSRGAPGIINGGIYRLRPVFSQGRCLDASCPNSGCAVYIWDCHGGDNQKWRAVERPGRGFSLISIQSGKALDFVAGGADNGVLAQIWDSWGGDPQTFAFNPQADGYQIVVRSSGKVVDVSGINPNNGARIHQWDWLNAGNQKWILDLVAAGAQADENTDANNANNNNNSKSSGLSGGAIAGIVIGCVGGVALIAIVAIVIVRRRNANLTPIVME